VTTFDSCIQTCLKVSAMRRAGLGEFGDVVINCMDSHTHKWSGSTSSGQIQPVPVSRDRAKGAFILAQVHLTFAEVFCDLSYRKLTCRNVEIIVLACSLACVHGLYTEQLG